MSEKPVSTLERDSNILSKELSERIAEEIEALKSGEDPSLIQRIRDGLEYRPMTLQGEFSPKERSEQFLKSLATEGS